MLTNFVISIIEVYTVVISNTNDITKHRKIPLFLIKIDMNRT